MRQDTMMNGQDAQKSVEIVRNIHNVLLDDRRLKVREIADFTVSQKRT